MSLRIYRIDTSIIGKIFGLMRRTDTPPLVTGGINGGLFRNVVRATNDLVNYDNHYIIKDKDELARFQNPLHDSWIVKEQYYIRHPKETRTRWLIEAEKFHEFIYREQVSEIIAFIRANLPVKYLSIRIRQGADFGSFVHVPITGMDLEGSAKIGLNTNTELVIECPEGLKPSEKRKEYVWLDDFQELKEVVDNFSHGEFRHVIRKDNSFCLKAKEAKTIGVGVSWLRTWEFELTFKA